MATTRERYEALLAAARARQKQADPASGQDPAQAASRVARAIEGRGPPADARPLTEDEVTQRIRPLVRAHVDMEGTGRGAVQLFDVRVTRAMWPEVGDLVRRVIGAWEDALERAHGQVGLCFVAELGYGHGRGVAREGRGRGTFTVVDDAAAHVALMTRFDAELRGWAVGPLSRPLQEAECLTPLRRLLAARRAMNELGRHGVRAQVQVLREAVLPADAEALWTTFSPRVERALHDWRSVLGSDHGDVGLAFLAELAYDAGAVDAMVDLSLTRDGPDRRTLRRPAPTIRVPPSVPAQIDWEVLLDHRGEPPSRFSGERLAKALEFAAAPLTTTEREALRAHGEWPKGEVFNPMKERLWPVSWLSFLAHAGTGCFLAGRVELSPLFTPVEMREYALAYHLPMHLPGAIPFAMDGGAGFYLFDTRDGLLDGELPVGYCHSTETAGWRRVEPVAPSFYELCSLVGH